MMPINPAIIFIGAGVVMAASPRHLRNILSLLIPLMALWQLLLIPSNFSYSLNVFDFTLQPLRMDALSFIFALIFIIVSFIIAIFSLHKDARLEQATIQLYAGSAIGAVLCGDLISLFVFFELGAITSAAIVYFGHSQQATQAALRYFLIHVAAGLMLLVGILMHYSTHGSLLFANMRLGETGSTFIFIAFGIKCAFPLLHNWLQDAYPKASAAGSVALSAFTTKLAVYCLARGFAGTEALIWIGAAMTAFPIFFAVIENDLRRVLSYSLNNQLGFMVVGIGIGTSLSLNGTAAHAFCHILYKALLFMSMGAVLHRIGTTRASQLGGLHKSMPWTAAFCIIGAMSISAFPLLSGFVSKGIILYSAAEEGLWIIWLILLFASAGVLDHSGIKVPFFAFFAHDAGYRCKEAPLNMLIAMGLAAFACI
ncbi:MAG TPA: Na(+)/H(+) antiporter subunit D, partial [Methylotenera sp.]|nr:Na(+)/H(+) antiporter subunit D [Methylotenera sp.]